MNAGRHIRRDASPRTQARGVQQQEPTNIYWRAFRSVFFATVMFMSLGQIWKILANHNERVKDTLWPIDTMPNPGYIETVLSGCDRNLATRTFRVKMIKDEISCTKSEDQCDLTRVLDLYIESVKDLGEIYDDLTEVFPSYLHNASHTVDTIFLGYMTSFLATSASTITSAIHQQTWLSNETARFLEKSSLLIGNAQEMTADLKLYVTHAKQNMTKWQNKCQTCGIVPEWLPSQEPLLDASDRIESLLAGLNYSEAQDGYTAFRLAMNFEEDRELETIIMATLRQQSLLATDMDRFIHLVSMAVEKKQYKTYIQAVRMYLRLKNEIMVWLSGGGFD